MPEERWKNERKHISGDLRFYDLKCDQIGFDSNNVHPSVGIFTELLNVT